GTFFYTQKGSIISTVVLPTTEIIEPNYRTTQTLLNFGKCFLTFFSKIYVALPMFVLGCCLNASFHPLFLLL
ncbi:hypothetical protein QE611_10010, partial [Streptococcus suis]|uniref:hypothetical protein n=1 Tax=Streptococcus suis TaxID=1307 RepID=UPI003756F8AF